MSKAKTGEAIVKELARKDFNKKCFDCGRGGPQANVNLTLNTFVCTSCSGLLRNFNHKVKTISMYTFPDAEVKALEEGGNKKARAYWLHFYDPENPREYKVDPDNQKSVLDFMKMMYENKKWCIEQPKKEEPKKEKKKKKEKKEESTGRSRAESRDEGEAEPEPVKHKAVDAAALKLKEPTKKEGRSRKSGAGEAKAANSSIDLLSVMGELSFDAPAPAKPASSGFGNDDFGNFDAGFGSSAPAPASSGFGAPSGGFDSDFTTSFSSAPASGAPAASKSAGGDSLASLVEKAASVKVNPSSVTALVYQIKSIASQYSLDAQHTQALVLQALGKIAAEPPSAAQPGAKSNGIDAFSDLPLPDDGPGAEPDSGNPFGSDDDDDDGPAPQSSSNAFGGAFGQPTPAAASFGGPQPGFGAPQQQMQPGFGQQGFGVPQQFAQPGFGGAQPGFGQPGFGGPQGFGAPQPGFGGPQPGFGGQGFGQPGFGGQPFGAPQQPQQQQQQPKPQTNLFADFAAF